MPLLLIIICASCAPEAAAPLPSPSVREVQVTEGVVLPSPSPTAAPLPSPSEDAASSQSYTEYSVSLSVEPDSGMVAGVEKVSYRNTTGESLDVLYFNVSLNAFSRSCSYQPYFDNFQSKIFENGVDHGYIDITSVTINGESVGFTIDETILVVEPKADLAPDERIEISLAFESYIPKINHRTGRNDSAMWFGNFLPTLAVYDGSWQVYPYYPAGDPFFSRVANYTVKVTTPAGYIVAGTGEESVLESDGKRVTTMTAKMVRDFAFALSADYTVSTVKTTTGVYVNMYCYSSLNNIEEFLETAKTSIEYYSETVGAYPYTSFDIFETGLFLSGGMEYPQLTFIDASHIRISAAQNTLKHEIAHQWFYNIIGSNQVTEAWLDEGLSSYVQMGIDKSAPEIDAYMETSYQLILDRAQTYEFHALSDDASVYENWSEYYAIQYSRARLMFYALHQTLGDEGFSEFLKTYYATYAYRIANRERLIQTAEAVYGDSLEEFFSGWIDDYELPALP